MATRTKFTKTPFRERERRKTSEKAETLDQLVTGSEAGPKLVQKRAAFCCVLLRFDCLRECLPSTFRVLTALRIEHNVENNVQCATLYTLQHTYISGRTLFGLPA